MANITKPTGVNNIFNEMKSAGMKISKDYLYDWLDYACQIYLFDRVPKYSKSYTKESLAPAKYYMADMGLRNAVLQPQSMDNGKGKIITFDQVDSLEYCGLQVQLETAWSKCKFAV